MAYACDWADGFSDYLAADFTKVWTTGSVVIGVSDVDGGTGQMTSSCRKSFANVAHARIMGFRYRYSTIGATVGVAAYRKTGQVQVRLVINSSGQLAILDANGAAVGQDVTTPLSANTYYVIEFGCLFDNSVGRVETRINGVQIAALTSIALGGTISNTLDTQNAAFTDSDSLELEAGLPSEVDWIWTKYDATVWSASDWLGMVRKITLRPKAGTAGNGFYNTGTGWSVGAGSTTLSDVMRESQMDSDTSFGVRAVAAGTDADRFSLIHDAMPTNTNAVKLFSHRSWVRNTAGSTSTHKRFLYESVGATTHDSGVTVTDGTSYASGVASGTTTAGDHMQDSFLVHPNGSALSKTLIDNTQIGVKVMTLA